MDMKTSNTSTQHTLRVQQHNVPLDWNKHYKKSSKQMTSINGTIAEEGLLLNNQTGKVLNGFWQVWILLETVGNCLQYFLVDMISTVTKSLLCSTVGGNGAWGGETNSWCRRAGWLRDGSEDSVEDDVGSCPFGLGLLWCLFFYPDE